MADSGDNYRPNERSRSPRRGRSRSPGRAAGHRRSYSPRSNRSRSPDYHRGPRRSRSPMADQVLPSGAPTGSAYGSGAPHRSNDDRQAARDQMMSNIRETSQQDRRVYVGNLSYDVKWHHLKDFMRQAGEVIFADVLLLPNGMSKGCGIVEYATREEAQNAVATLSNQNLMGRLVYVREDREAEPRFNQSSGPRGGFSAPGPQAYGGGAMGGGFGGGAGGAGGAGRQIYVGNLPYTVGWQDLKDLFRQAARTAGVARADINMGPDRKSRGSGIVVFESPDDAQNAIQQFNGYNWQGRELLVREDRFAGGGYGGRGRGGYMGGRGDYGGGRGYNMFPGHGPYGATVPAPGRNDNEELRFPDNATAGTERSESIFVRNLPWSTSNDDLVELFTTIGKVDQAGIQYEQSGRSRGSGVVKFDSPETAETAISKFQGYQYGGRPLGLSFVKYFNKPEANNSMDIDQHGGLTQDQIM